MEKKRKTFNEWLHEIECDYPPINYDMVKTTARKDGVTPRIALKCILKSEFDLTDYMADKLSSHLAYLNM